MNRFSLLVVIALLGSGPLASEAAPAGARTESAPEPRVVHDQQPSHLKWLIPSAHAAGVLLASRVGAGLIWPDGFSVADARFSTFKQAWTRPPLFREDEAFFEWDSDGWPINALGHGLMGSEIYLRHRQARFSLATAAAMTLIWTAVWEYLIEAPHKRPSSVDLVWTPAGGLLLGEARHELFCWVRQMRRSTWRGVLLYVIDPIGQLERDLFGLPW